MNTQEELDTSVDYHSDCMESFAKALNYENENYEKSLPENIVSAIRKLRQTIARQVVNKVHPAALYPVKYKIHPNGDKEFGDFRVKGMWLTENQMIDLALNGTI